MADDNTAGLGTMLAFLSQNKNQGQQGMPQLPNIPNMQLPDTSVQMPQNQGSGLLKGILGNVASSYIAHKFKSYQDKQDAEETGQVLSDQIGAHKKLYKDGSGMRNYLDTMDQLANKKTPATVKLAVKGYEDFNQALSKNEEQTALAKDAILSGINANNPSDALLLRRKFGGTHLPTSYEYDQNGNMIPIQTPEGENINDIITQRSIATKQEPGFGAEETQKRLQDMADFTKQMQQANLEFKEKSLEQSAENAKNNLDKLEPMPAPHRMAWMTNNSTITQAERAQKLVEAHPEYFNITTRTGETYNQYISPEGVSARAEVAAIGGTQFHTLAGATGTTGEQKLYYPFIPNIEKDSPDTIVKKLKGFQQRTKDFMTEFEDAYSEGFKHVPWQNKAYIAKHPELGPSKYDGAKSEEPIETDAQLKAVGISQVKNLRLSPKAMSMPKEKQDMVMDILNNGSEKDQLKLLQKGWLGE